MGGVDVQVSVTNLVQMDRHQSDVHRAPVVNQEQNADTARQEAAHRMRAPVESGKTEGQVIDPRNKREREQGGKKKRQKNNSDGGLKQDRLNNFTRRTIDFEA